MTSEYWDHIRIFENGKSFIIQLFNGAIYPPDAPKVWIAELKRDKIAHAEILHLAAVIPDGRLTTFVKDIRDRDLGKDLVLEYQYHPMPRTGTEPILPVSNVRKLWTVMKDHMSFIEYIDWKEMKRK
jgi:hypothetical protein